MKPSNMMLRLNMGEKWRNNFMKKRLLFISLIGAVLLCTSGCSSFTSTKNELVRLNRKIDLMNDNLERIATILEVAGDDKI